MNSDALTNETVLLVQLAWSGVLVWLVLGGIGLLLQRWRGWLIRLVFPLGALTALYIAELLARRSAGQRF